MRSLSNSPRPPRLAAWLVELYASADHAESLLGDLSEEFSEIAWKSGVVSARRWYGRQVARTIAHLAGAGFRVAPWRLTGAALLGFLLCWLGMDLPADIIVAVLRTQRPYSNLHYNFYVWLLTWGIPIVRVVEMTLIGCVVAAVAKGREIVATMVLIIAVSVVLGLFLFFRPLSLPSRIPIPWSFFVIQAFEDWTAILVGGILILKIRAASLRRNPRALI